MFEQFNTKQFVDLSKQFANTAIKAQGLAINGFERALDVQMKVMESTLTANVDFWTQAVEVRDINGVRDLMPKSVALVKDNAETMYSTSQELVGINVKTAQAIGDLMRGSVEAANDSFKSTVGTKKTTAAK